MAEPTEKKGPRELLRVASRHPILFVVSSGLVALGALGVAHFLPLKYTGTAVFETQRDAADTVRGVGDAESFATYKVTLVPELQDRTAVEALVKQLGLDRGPQYGRDSEGNLTAGGKIALQALVKKIIDNTEVKWEVKSDLRDRVSLSYTDEDPQLAQLVPNELVKNYITSVHKRLESRLTESLGFLKEQTTARQRRLSELDANRIAFEQEHAPLPLDSPGTLVERIETTEARLAELRSEKKAAEIRLRAAETRFEQLAKSFPEQAKALAFGPTRPPATGSTTRPATAPAGTAAPRPTSSPSARPAKQPVAHDKGEPSTRPESAAQTRPATQPSTQPGSPTHPPVHYVKSPNPEHQRLKEQLRQENDNLDQARIVRRMKDTHPTVQALLAKIARLEKLIAETASEIDLPDYRRQTPTTAGGSPTETPADPLQVYALNDARANWEQAKREVEDLSRAAGPLEKRLVELRKLEAAFAPKVQRYKEINEEIRKEQAELAGWQKRMMEVQTALAAETAMRRTRLDTVQAAQEQLKPSSPKLLYVLGFAIAFGLAVGALVVYVANMLDHTIATPEDAREHFELRVLGVIGEIVTNKQRLLRKLRRRLLVPVVVILVLGCVTVAAFSNTLRLNSPDLYAQWARAPAAFMRGQVQQVVAWVSGRLS